jgi:hypothetical protein
LTTNSALRTKIAVEMMHFFIKTCQDWGFYGLSELSSPQFFQPMGKQPAYVQTVTRNFYKENLDVTNKQTDM